MQAMMAASRTSRVRVQARFVANVAVNHHVNSGICTLFLKELLRDNHVCVALKAWGIHRDQITTDAQGRRQLPPYPQQSSGKSRKRRTRRDRCCDGQERSS